jgi:hypothetical protein
LLFAESAAEKENRNGDDSDGGESPTGNRRMQGLPGPSHVSNGNYFVRPFYLIAVKYEYLIQPKRKQMRVNAQKIN